MKYNENLNQFIEANALPDFIESWNDAADFLEIPFVNGGAQAAISARFAPAKEVKADNLSAMLAEALNPYFKGPAIDENRIIELIKEYAPVKIAETRVIINEVAGTIPGRQHNQFETVLKLIAAGLNVYLYGPAGTGKTQIAENAAIALNKEFYCISVCAQSTKSDLLGYMNAGGQYVPTLFRQAYENGGCFLLDEIDNGNPNVLAVLNSALANGYCAFADKMVKRHSEFVLIASANTFGTGADRTYVGRNQLDAATLNRFVQVEINYDQDLEKEIFGDIAEPIQNIRFALRSERVIVSMRNISHAAKLMKVGYTQAQAIELAVKNTIPHNLRSRI